ncbi:MAG: tetratricopeptide repeat protein [Anaerolineae bacterium]|nr:tetratricopeptide repeat protein [Anaerolineae bacterium]
MPSPQPPAATAVTSSTPAPTVTTSPMPLDGPTPTATYTDVIVLYLEAGWGNYEEGDYVAALNDFSYAVVVDKQCSECYYLRGLSFIGYGDIESALDDLNESIRLYPYRPGSYLARAQILFEEGEFDAALSDLAQAETLDVNIGGIYLLRGRLYEAIDGVGNPSPRALEEYHKAALLMPDNAEVYHYRGAYHFAQGNFDFALTDMNIALTIDPQRGDTYALRARYHALTGAYELAAEDYQAAIENGVTDTGLLLELGQVYLIRDEAEKALEVFEQAVEQSPDQYQTHYWKSAALLETDQVYFALVEANTALDYSPGNVRVRLLRATLYLNLQRYDDAIADYEAYREVNPDEYRVLLGLAEAKYRKGDLNGAEEVLYAYLDASPENDPYRPQIEAMVELIARSGEDQPTPTPNVEGAPYEFDAGVGTPEAEE